MIEPNLQISIQDPLNKKRIQELIVDKSKVNFSQMKQEHFNELVKILRSASNIVSTLVKIEELTHDNIPLESLKQNQLEAFISIFQKAGSDIKKIIVDILANIIKTNPHFSKEFIESSLHYIIWSAMQKSQTNNFRFFLTKLSQNSPTVFIYLLNNCFLDSLVEELSNTVNQKEIDFEFINQISIQIGIFVSNPLFYFDKPSLIHQIICSYEYILSQLNQLPNSVYKILSIICKRQPKGEHIIHLFSSPLLQYAIETSFVAPLYHLLSFIYFFISFSYCSPEFCSNLIQSSFFPQIFQHLLNLQEFPFNEIDNNTFNNTNINTNINSNINPNIN